MTDSIHYFAMTEQDALLVIKALESYVDQAQKDEKPIVLAIIKDMQLKL